MSARPEGGILAIFDELDSTVAAIDALRAAGFRKLIAFTPVPRHEIDHAMHTPESPIRVFTLVGGLTGAATGFAMPTWMSTDWPLLTGGKPIVSLPPFVIIAFELTILFGALSTVLGLLITARLPRTRLQVVYDPAFSAGRFGVYVLPGAGKDAEARKLMSDNGAAEIRERPEEVRVDTF